MKKEKYNQKKTNIYESIIVDYQHLKPLLKQRLDEFKNVPIENYFYEICFCICTPQSSARHALQVVNRLKEQRFFEFQFDPVEILRLKDNYVRFHNTKSFRLLALKEIYTDVLEILKSTISDKEKRINISSIIKGFGMKETSHFMRNIGYRNLAILDRHILKNLTLLNVFENVPKVGTVKTYLESERKFIEFANNINIPLDELDLLFWSMETGEVLK